MNEIEQVEREVLHRLDQADAWGDTPAGQRMAAEALCTLLSALGYSGVVEKFKAVTRTP